MSWYRSITILACLAAVTVTSNAAVGQHNHVFTMCIPEIYWKDCVQMMEDSASKGIPISCISGRDRYECIEKVGKREADVVAVDPEDMYLAVKDNGLPEHVTFNVIEQIRTKEEPDAAYRYEAVAVIHKDLDINNVQGLRGLKSCHTGVGRNVGYKIPITKLTAMGVLDNLNDPEYSARENELRALSSLFSKGCLVGTWSQHPEINRRLKETYSNMCALCEKPDVCDYPDIYSGYEGALRCLAHNGGDVAWTKVIYVKRFFGLPVGVTPAVPTNEDPSNFRYFCPDGTKVPITADTKPCTWAARPWQGYMANGKVEEIENVQKELTELGELGEKEKAAWWKDLMLLDEKTLAVPSVPIGPEQHLKTAKYYDVIERNSGAPDRNARWCVWTQPALYKCEAMARAAYSRDARPKLSCLLKPNRDACMAALNNNEVDLIVVDGGSVYRDEKETGYNPILSEVYGAGSTEFNERPAVVVVKKGSSINGLADLKGKRSCHSGYKEDFAGWLAPVHALKKANLINSEDDMADFFAGSCAPGAPSGSKLCQQCVGNIESNDDKVTEATKCKPTKAEAFKGGQGAIKCLTSDKGDVAFLPLPALMKIDKKNETEGGVKTSDFMLVCPNGGLVSVDEWQRCNLGLEPPRVIITSHDKTGNALDVLRHGVLAFSSIYSKRPDLLQLFGSWGGEPNVLFSDDAVDLATISTDYGSSWKRWNETKTDYKIEH